MKKLAVIGSGIAGMSSALFLKEDFDVTLYEKNNYIGGHTNTIIVNDGVNDCPMDTGFMVFNEKTYPNLLKLFKLLDVDYIDTDMSFSVRNNLLDLEYNGTNVAGLFAQKKNIFNYKFLKMIADILTFSKKSPDMLDINNTSNMTIKEYVSFLGLGDYFYNNFLVPMSSAVWSTPMEKIASFPAKSLIRFFHNHGFVGIDTQLQWKTVNGGSREYRNKLMDKFNGQAKTSEPVIRVSRQDSKIIITTKEGSAEYDKVVIATHADEALKLLSEPTDLEIEVLGKFSYQKNIATVHTDITVMPKLKKNWSSWNFIISNGNPYTVYYMNRLQGVSKKKDFFVNINGEEYINSEKIIKTIEYHHPVFDLEAVKAQEKMDELNKKTNIHFTGSYYRYGFHEDALLSSVNLCKELLGREVFS